MRRNLKGIAVVPLLAGAVSCAGCSGNDGATNKADKPIRGGSLTVLTSGDLQSLDPGIDYTGGIDQSVLCAMVRTLFAYVPGPSVVVRPDLAASPAAVSADNRTVTIRIRPGVHYSPPVNREIKADDFKYAIERAFSANVPNGYAATYFHDIVGAPRSPTRGVHSISGIETPDDRTLVIHLGRPTAGTVVNALVLPIGAPVPQEYAKRFDRRSPSTYADHVAFTGPYMVASDASGALRGHRPNVEIKMVRNPNWRSSTDFRPAYLDSIDIRENADDVELAARQAIDGSRTIDASDPPPSALRRVAGARRSQLVSFPSANFTYIALNTSVAPFDDLNVRRALAAVLDRSTLRQLRGGPSVGQIPTHMLPPGFPGFEAAGGQNGPGLDFLAHPGGNIPLARSYMRKAGFAGGSYTGKVTPLFVVANDSDAAKRGEFVRQQFGRVGVHVRVKLVTSDEAFRLCSTPSAKVGVCAYGAAADFADGQGILDAQFDGAGIVRENNSNWAMLDDPRINSAMRRASLLPPGHARDDAWADVDRMISASAAGIPTLWKQVNLVQSRDVQGVITAGYPGWELAFTSVR
jgi:peptide/nickel transport system substrate-binding protein